jgi:hypothetical protein
MQFKPITAIIVLLLVVASLLVAGCTTSTTNQTPSASTATRDAFLEKYIAAYKNVTYSDKNESVKAFEVTWINSTSARVEDTTFNKTSNLTVNVVKTVMVFPTSQDATNYLNAMNKTAYSLASTIYPSGGAYQKASGNTPQIYKRYEWNEGNPFNISEYKLHGIEQADNLIAVTTVKMLTS